jgi:zinc protease
MRSVRRWLAVPLVLLVFAPPVPAQRERGAPRAWEHETSDVPVDARIRFGHLDNGVRWAWVRNTEPHERCYLRMHVDAGSLEETDAQRGMAHFVEHMAFNGTDHFKPGDLVEWFQEHGMDFGPDANAATDFRSTVYEIDLPQSDEKSLREGLLVLSDFARGMKFAPAEVEAEKPVIDAEERERLESAQGRVFKEMIGDLLAGTRYALRMPIGVKAVRDAFKAEGLRAFYDEWYRPENVTLIAVGDFGELDPAPLFAALFGDWVPPEDAPEEEPEAGTPTSYAHFFSIREPELPTVTIEVERVVPWKDEPNTKARMVEDLPVVVARGMLNLRFSELVKKPDAPFLGASAGDAEFLDTLDGESLAVSSRPERWEEALTFCEHELRRALQHGFQESELAEMRANMLRNLDEAVEREPTRNSGRIAADIVHAAEERYVPTQAAARRAILKPVLDKLTVEDCHKAFVKAWGDGDLSIFAYGDLDLGEDANARLRAVWDKGGEGEVEARAAEETSAFAYASDPDVRGEIVERKHLEDLDAEALRFENGVTLNVKRTDFKDHEILVHARLGEGRLTLEPEKTALPWVADRVMGDAGLGKHDIDELRRLCAGHVVGGGFTCGGDAFVISGATTADDLLFECELLGASLRDPGWRDDGLVQLRRALPAIYEQLQHDVQGPLLVSFLPALYGGDPRVTPVPPLEAVQAVTMDDLKAWLAPELADAPLEVTLVGDLDVEAAIEAAARTFGTLPERRALRPYTERRAGLLPRSGVRQDKEIDTQDKRALVFLGYPTADGIDGLRRRSLDVLARLLNDRMRVDVRERLGAAYSPAVRSQASRVHPGNGLIFVQLFVDPAATADGLAACLDVAGTLAAKGPAEDELQRIREPILKELRDARRTNGYWVDVLDETHRRPESLDDARGAEADYEGLTAEGLAKQAASYLTKEKASTLIVRPRAQKAEPVEAGAAKKDAAEGGATKKDE